MYVKTGSLPSMCWSAFHLPHKHAGKQDITQLSCSFLFSLVGRGVVIVIAGGVVWQCFGGLLLLLLLLVTGAAWVMACVLMYRRGGGARVQRGKNGTGFWHHPYSCCRFPRPSKLGPDGKELKSTHDSGHLLGTVQFFPLPTSSRPLVMS